MFGVKIVQAGGCCACQSNVSQLENGVSQLENGNSLDKSADSGVIAINDFKSGFGTSLLSL